VALDICIFLGVPPDDWLPVGAVLTKLSMVIKFNCTNIDSYKADYNAEDASFTNLHMGQGVYLTFSLINHSCDANTYQVVYGTSLVIRARRPIKKGEQITFCYTKPATKNSYEVRQMTLLEEYKFKCR
jgi:SET domain-containing protein